MRSSDVLLKLDDGLNNKCIILSTRSLVIVIVIFLAFGGIPGEFTPQAQGAPSSESWETGDAGDSAAGLSQTSGRVLLVLMPGIISPEKIDLLPLNPDHCQPAAARAEETFENILYFLDSMSWYTNERLYFSYRRETTTKCEEGWYGKSDTYGSIWDSADLLQNQFADRGGIQQYDRIDILAHSLGGAVALAWAYRYYPTTPINIITHDSPVNGCVSDALPWICDITKFYFQMAYDLNDDAFKNAFRLVQGKSGLFENVTLYSAANEKDIIADFIDASPIYLDSGLDDRNNARVFQISNCTFEWPHCHGRVLKDPSVWNWILGILTPTSIARCIGPLSHAPVSGSTLPSRTIAFRWVPATGCTFSGYEFRVKTVANMDSGGTTISSAHVAGTQTTLSIDPQLAGQWLYWGVRAANTTAAAPWQVHRFRLLPGFENCSPPLGKPAVMWMNPAGGDWQAGDNWSTGQVPLPDEYVCITLPGSYTVTVTGGVSVAGVTNAGTMVLTSPCGYFCPVMEIGGTLTNTGTIRAASHSGWHFHGDLANSGTVTIEETATLVLAKAGMTFTNSGTISVATGGHLMMGRLDLGWSGYGPMGTVNFTQTGGSLSANGIVGLDAPANGSITINGGSVVASGLVQFSAPTDGRVIINGGSITGNRTTDGSNATFRVSGPLTLHGGSIGSAIAVEYGSIEFANQNLSLTILAKQLRDLIGTIPPDVTLEVRESFAALGSFSNAGTMVLTSPCGYFCPVMEIGGTLTNTGTIRAASHSGWHFHGDLANSGTVTIEETATLVLAKAGMTFTNSGTISVATGGHLMMGRLDLGWSGYGPMGTVNFTQTGGSLSANGIVGLDAPANGSITINGGNVAGTRTTDTTGSTVQIGGSFRHNGGHISGVVAVLGELAFGAQVQGSGTIRTPHGSSRIITNVPEGTVIEADAGLTIATDIINYGTMSLRGSCGSYCPMLTVAGTLSNNGTLQIEAGSSWQLDGALTNNGTLHADGGLHLTKNGTILTNNGNIALSSSGSVSFANGTLSNLTSGTIIGSGQLTGALMNAGAILPGNSIGMLTINGNLAQLPSGSIKIDIEGTSPGVSHDQLVVAGSATLAGTLNFHVSQAFSPEPGDSFKILTYNSHAGSFSSIAGLTSNEVTLQSQVSGTSLTLVASTLLVPDVRLTKSHDSSFVVGQNGNYILTVHNIGTTATLDPITITDTLPVGIGFIKGTGANWNCDTSGQTVTCINPGPLAPTASSVVTLTVSVGSAAVPTVTNTAAVSTTGDTNSTNNSASVTTTVLTQPNIRGDLDGNGIVDIFDLSRLLSKWGSTDPVADLNGNGSVDVFDLSILLSNWHKTATADNVVSMPAPVRTRAAGPTSSAGLNQTASSATSTQFSPSGITLANVGDQATVTITQTGLPPEVNAGQWYIGHSPQFSVTQATCAGPFTGGTLTSITAESNGSAFACGKQGTVGKVSPGPVATFVLTRLQSCQGSSTLTLRADGPSRTTYVHAGTPVGAGTLGTLQVSCAGGTLHGTISLRGRTAASQGGIGLGIGTVALDGGAAMPLTASGAFTLTGITNGTHTLTICAPGYLCARLSVELVAGVPTAAITNIVLPAGLVDSDNSVSISDVTALISAFGSRPPNRLDSQGRVVDINGDGVVNIHDITLTLASFGQVSPITWP